MALSTAQATRTLAAVQLRTLLHTLRTHLKEKRLLFFTIATFLSLYAIGAYVLVARGLAFIHAVPLLGPMLTERLIYVLFFFFFGMLVVSNATITGMSLFRRQETGWLISLPLSFRSLVLWKTMEGMVLASWGLLLLSAPVLVAVGELFDSPPAFYWHTLPALLCLVTVASNLSSWLLLALIRWLRREWLKPVAVAAFGGLAVLAVAIWPSSTNPSRAVDVAANVAQILQHTDAFTHPLLPSSWVAETVLAAGQGTMPQAGFYNLVLVSHALLSLLVTIHVASHLFYPAWTRSMHPTQRRLSAIVPRRIAWPRWLQWLPVDATDRALMMKDLRTFVREPSQWGQSVLVFGLLFLYTVNLRRIALNYHDPFWSVVTSYLNLLVCSLSLSTLTTRFIFPQISLEGQRLWLLSLSPLPFHRLLRAKLLLTTTITGTVTLSLVLLSCQMLEIAWERTAFFCICIVLLTIGLNALALGLGAVFPNLRETNPAKIVSGFGGTLCLIMSFVYISACVATALIPGLPLLRPSKASMELPQRLLSLGLSLSGILLLTLLFGLVPYWMAQKRIKNLDYFGRL